ncbi:MAG: cation-transporting P-type ATPase, partial [Actinomycetota bacterium]|nr:cation-transporting P-type ATPase [Actinomycetota bacterium]
MTTSPTESVDLSQTWFDKPVDDVLSALGSNADSGLSSGEATSRLATYGPNVIAAEPSPSVWAVALTQLKDSMNLM